MIETGLFFTDLQLLMFFEGSIMGIQDAKIFFYFACEARNVSINATLPFIKTFPENPFSPESPGEV